MSNVTFKGNSIRLNGNFPKKGDAAPDFTLCTADLRDISLTDFSDKTILLNIFPSIDTPVCSASVRAFNEKVSKIENVVVLCISADLPFALSRFCETEGLEHVITASCFRSKGFSKDYGVEISDGPLRGLTARTVIIIKNNSIIYSELVSEITDEPNYNAAISVLNEM